MISSFYLGHKLARIWTVLVGSSGSTQTVLVSPTDLERMAGSAEKGGTLRHNSFSSAIATGAVTNLLLS
jgi:hypothetical protein